MYNRKLKRYNRRRNSRNYRRNPGVNTPTLYTKQEPEATTYFKSATRARNFLIKNSDKNPDEGSKLWKQLRDAKKLVIQTDKRNLRRQVKSLAKRGLTPRVNEHTGGEALTPEEILRHPRIAQQLAVLQIPMNRFLGWCGEEDEKLAQRLCDLRNEIVQQQCDIPESKSTWEVAACESSNLCSTGTKARPRLKLLSGGGRKPLAARYQRNVTSSRFKARKPRSGSARKSRNKESHRVSRKALGSTELHSWEELLDPNGEVVRFRVERYKNKHQLEKIKQVVRDSSAPKPGDIVLDLTRGIHAFKVTRSGRVSAQVTREMRGQYENSFLYQVRSLAAGRLSAKGFISKVQTSAKQ